MSSDEPVLPDRTKDEESLGWGDEPDDDERRLREELPPHHVDRDRVERN